MAPLQSGGVVFWDTVTPRVAPVKFRPTWAGAGAEKTSRAARARKRLVRARASVMAEFRIYNVEYRIQTRSVDYEIAKKRLHFLQRVGLAFPAVEFLVEGG